MHRAATGQFAFMLRETSSGPQNETIYFYQTVVEGKFKRLAGNHFRFQSSEVSSRWQGADGQLKGTNERSYAFFNGEVTEELSTGAPVQITLAFLSKGPWDKLEARDQMTVMQSVPRIEFGGWFLTEDADSSEMNGRPVIHSAQGPAGIAGRTGQMLEGVIPYSGVTSLGY